MPSNMLRAMLWATGGLQRMLWTSRAKPAQVRSRRSLNLGNGKSMASRRSPSLAACPSVVVDELVLPNGGPEQVKVMGDFA